MKLYYAPSACSLAPHILLRELGLPFELERVDLRTKRTQTGKEYRLVNPKGYVPALELDDGSVITEAPTILKYIADNMPDRGFAPDWGTRARYDFDSWLNFISSELHKPFGAFMAPLSEEQKRFHVEKITHRLDWVESELSRRPWLVGDHYGAADIYLFVITSWADQVGIDLKRWPDLCAWREQIAEHSAVKEAIAAEKTPVSEPA